MYTSHKVIVDIDNCEKENFFCKICKFPMTNYRDYKTSKAWDCCNHCYLEFAEARRKDWKDGWRPDKTVVDRYIYKRKCMYGIEE